MIKTVEENVQAVRLANSNGILSVYGNRVQVNHQLFRKLLNEKGSLEVRTRNDDTYRYETAFICNGLTYFTIHTEEELINKFGGNINELITSN